jgi:putative ABC transport system permease protein
MATFSLSFTLRSLARRRGFTAASLLGLSVGTAACLVVALFVLDELSFDAYHENKDRIYRVVNLSEPGSVDDGIAKVNGPWGTSAKIEIPEVADVTRFVPAGQMFMKAGDKRFFESQVFFADPSVFLVFSFKLTEGNPEKALLEPNTIVLTRTMKERFFGSADALGQTLEVDNTPYRISGVMEEVPVNSHFTFSFLISMESYRHPDRDDWVRWNQFYTYVLLQPGSDPASVAGKMKSIVDSHVDEQQAETYYPSLQPLTSIHLYSHLFREIRPNSSAAYVYVFSSIAILILGIACLNFINLSVAQGSTRAKEIGVRKVNGAARIQLIGQFLGETFVITAVAVIIAHGLASLATPYLNTITGKVLSLDYQRFPGLGLIVLAVAVGTALLAGLLPAVRLSSLRPVFTMKGKSAAGGAGTLRKSLVSFQFALSSLLVIASLIILNQLDYIQNKPSGFEPQQVITLPINTAVFRDQHETVVKELAALPGVMQVSVSGNLPGGSDWGIPALAEGFTQENMPPMRMLAVDHHFVDTYGMTLASGRSFSSEFTSDSASYLINEEAARQLQWTNPLRKSIAMPALGRPSAPIVGVVRDFHFRSLHENIGPLLFFIPPSNWFSTYSIRIAAEGSGETIRRIEERWRQFDPEHPFQYAFFDDSFRSLHEQDRRLAKLVNLFSGIGVFLACLGLYSLAALTTGQRTKEIGIRKVIGATTAQIVGLLTGQYVKLVVLGFIIALPLALWLGSQWLESFAYRDSPPVWLILTGCLSLVLLALVTVAGQSIGAARRNPVNSLRSE